jgi:hypothetical protein
VEVVVAEHHGEPGVVLDRPAQQVERTGPAVDQIAHQPEPVGRRRVGDAAQQPEERGERTVDVADRVGRHAERTMAQRACRRKEDQEGSDQERSIDALRGGR